MQRFADFCFALAVVLFLIGGIWLQFPIAGNYALIEISQPWFLLAPFTVLFLLNRTDQTKAMKHLPGLMNKANDLLVKFPWGVLGSFFLVMFLNLLSGSLNRYLSFSSRWDLAIYAQACGSGMYSSLRDETTLLADHFEPLLFLFTPLCAAFDPAIVLLVVQSLFFTLGGVGVYSFSRHQARDPLTSLFLAFLYLSFNGLVRTHNFDFHLISLALGLLPWMFLFFERGQNIALIIAIAMYLCLKENCSLTIAGLGMYWALTSNRKTVGLLMFATGAAAFIVVMEVVFPFFRDGAQSGYFARHYGYMGQDLRSVLTYIVANPITFTLKIASWERLIYICKILAPFLGIPILFPSTMIPIFPALSINLLSQSENLHSGLFHYEAEIYPVLFLMMLCVSQRKSFLWIRWPRLFPAWMLFFLSIFGGHSLFWWARYYQPNKDDLRLHKQLYLEWSESKNARFATTAKLAAHLSRAQNLYLLRGWRDADLIILARVHDSLWPYPASLKHLKALEESHFKGLFVPQNLSGNTLELNDLRIWRKK